MQEFLIIFVSLLALFFLVYGGKSQNHSFLVIGGIFLILLGLGILSTGWERYEGHLTATDLSATVTQLNPTLTTHNATQSENPTLFIFGIITVLFGSILTMVSVRDYRLTKAIQKD